MSLKLKRNLPLVFSLLMLVLVLVLVFGSLRIGATNIRLGTWVELRVTSAAQANAPLAAAGAQDAGSADAQILLENITGEKAVY